MSEKGSKLPEQEKFTPEALIASTPIHWNDPGRGRRLRAAYFRKRGADPNNLTKRISAEVIERVMQKFRARRIGFLMRDLFEAGHLNQYRMRRI